MNKYTPKPWRIDNDDRFTIRIEAQTEDGYYEIASLDRDEGEEWEDEVIANARLIAAAPELLKALRGSEIVIKNLLWNCDPKSGVIEATNNVLLDARAAIKAATGK